jgi:hypothetical protein
LAAKYYFQLTLTLKKLGDFIALQNVKPIVTQTVGAPKFKKPWAAVHFASWMKQPQDSYVHNAGK